jgi:hypothetical protein
MLLIKDEEVTVYTRWGLCRAYTLFVKNYFDLSEVCPTRPDFENYFTNIKQEIDATFADKENVIRVITFHVNVFPVFYFEWLKQRDNTC